MKGLYHSRSGEVRPGDGGLRWLEVSRRSVLVLLGVVVILGAVFGVMGAILALNRSTGVRSREVTIKKGMSVAEIAGLLHREGIIRSPRLLRTFSVLNGTSRRLTAGVHRFHGRMTAWQVLLELEVPRDVTRDVTIPEGLRREQVARVLAASLGLDEDKLLAITSDPALCRELGVEAETLEGYLFPETYRFSLAMTELQVVRLMVDHFSGVFDSEMRKRARDMGMSAREVVTLASIIEGEAVLDHERRLISAVYHNRLQKRMRLQADPTVQYAIPDGPRRLFNRDYKIDSPYNTYRHYGLPPGPILSPGEASIRAAVDPADVSYLYFVAQGDGSHIFSRTMQEHEAAKRKTRRARRNMWRRSAN